MPLSSSLSVNYKSQLDFEERLNDIFEEMHNLTPEGQKYLEFINYKIKYSRGIGLLSTNVRELLQSLDSFTLNDLIQKKKELARTTTRNFDSQEAVARHMKLLINLEKNIKGVQKYLLKEIFHRSGSDVPKKPKNVVFLNYDKTDSLKVANDNKFEELLDDDSQKKKLYDYSSRSRSGGSGNSKNTQPDRRRPFSRQNSAFRDDNEPLLSPQQSPSPQQGNISSNGSPSGSPTQKPKSSFFSRFGKGMKKFFKNIAYALKLKKRQQSNVKNAAKNNSTPPRLVRSLRMPKNITVEE